MAPPTVLVIGRSYGRDPAAADHSSSVEVIIDLTGYHAPPIQGPLTSAGAVFRLQRDYPHPVVDDNGTGTIGVTYLSVIC